MPRVNSGTMRLVWHGLAIAAMVAADQVVKWWAAARLMDKAVTPLIPGVVHLIYVENRGAAFGILQNMRVFFLILTAAALIFIVVAQLRRWPRHPLGVWSLTLIMGGALGNFIDRAAQGYVVDMFEFEFVRFAIFNVADMFVSIGGVLFCIYLLFMHEQKDGGKSDAVSPSV